MKVTDKTREEILAVPNVKLLKLVIDPTDQDKV
jgi:hypothetical protein